MAGITFDRWGLGPRAAARRRGGRVSFGSRGSDRFSETGLPECGLPQDPLDAASYHAVCRLFCKLLGHVLQILFGQVLVVICGLRRLLVVRHCDPLSSLA